MRRRDFTVNAMARRLATGDLVDPLGGRADLEARRLRTVSAQSFREDPLRLVRALRFVSQLGFEPDEALLAQMREEAPAVKLVSGERIGGGLAADGMGELSKLLLGAEPARALRLARDTGVLVELLPEFGPAIGFDQESRYHDLTVDEHTFAVVQAAADQGFSLPVRLAALFHDLGKPIVGWRGHDGRLHYYAKPGFAAHGHDQVGADLAADALLRLRYPNALAPARRPRSCAATCSSRGRATPSARRRFLRRNGDELAFDLLDHKHADLLGKRGTEGEPPPFEEIERLARFREVVEQERSSPHRLRDLAVDGNDLIGLGFEPGPQLGHILHELLDARRGRARPEHARAAARAGEGAAVIRWEVDGYEVAFTTRVGGVSEGPYASLNLGRKSGDDPERVDENRRIACEAIGADVEQLALNYQVHSDPRAARGAGACAASTQTGSGPTSPACRSSPCPPTACRSPSRGWTRPSPRSPFSTSAGEGCSPASSRPGRRRSGGRHARRRDRPRHRPVLLRGGGGGRDAVPRALRRRRRPRRPSRSLDERRARAPRRRSRRRSTASTAVPPASPRRSSRTGATPAAPAARG